MTNRPHGDLGESVVFRGEAWTVAMLLSDVTGCKITLKRDRDGYTTWMWERDFFWNAKRPS